MLGCMSNNFNHQPWTIIYTYRHHLQNIEETKSNAFILYPINGLEIYKKIISKPNYISLVLKFCLCISFHSLLLFFLCLPLTSTYLYD